jgi:hypothetical protein
MSLDSHGARLTRRDVVDLAQASEQLAVVSGMIRSSGVKWGEVAVNLLIVVNNSVVRIQSKGARAFARYLERHPPETAEELPPDDMPDSERVLLYPRPPKEPEEG